MTLKYGFRTEYCLEIIEHLSSNGSFYDFAKKRGVTTDAIYRWMEYYSQFYESVQIGREKRKSLAAFEQANKLAH